jgi:hypothetical protein
VGLGSKVREYTPFYTTEWVQMWKITAKFDNSDHQARGGRRLGIVGIGVTGGCALKSLGPFGVSYIPPPISHRQSASRTTTAINVVAAVYLALHHRSVAAGA